MRTDLAATFTCRVLTSLVLFFSATVVSSQVLAQPFKILHVMSYQGAWDWNRDQLNGFKSSLEEFDIEYQVFEMNTKNNPDAASKAQKGKQALALVKSWKPDLVYTNDDDAQEYFGRYLAGTTTPMVFSGVNEDPSKYGYRGSPNVTGVMEVEHSSQTIDLLRQLDPSIKQIALVLDHGPTWPSVVRRVKKAIAENNDVDVLTTHTFKRFADYQEFVLESQTEVDALGLLGIFGMVDEQGQNVPFEDVLKWTANNSQLPDFSFWESRAQHGTLCAVSVSGWAQGQAAGNMAKQILSKERQPHEINMTPTRKGQPVISLARARQLDLPVSTTLLLNSHVFKSFSWDKLAEH